METPKDQNGSNEPQTESRERLPAKQEWQSHQSREPFSVPSDEGESNGEFKVGLSLITFVDLFTKDQAEVSSTSADKVAARQDYHTKKEALLHPKDTESSKFHYIAFSELPLSTQAQIVKNYQTSSDAVKASMWYVKSHLDPSVDDQLDWKLYCVSTTYHHDLLSRPQNPAAFGLARFSFEDLYASYGDVIEGPNGHRWMATTWDRTFTFPEKVSLVTDRIVKWLKFSIGSTKLDFLVIKTYVPNDLKELSKVVAEAEIGAFSSESLLQEIDQLKVEGFGPNLWLLARNNGEFEFLCERVKDLFQYIGKEPTIYYLGSRT